VHKFSTGVNEAAPGYPGLFTEKGRPYYFYLFKFQNRVLAAITEMAQVARKQP
jgi:hypothetical protein